MKIKVVVWQRMEYGMAQFPRYRAATPGEKVTNTLKMLEEAIQGWLEVASEREPLEPRQQFRNRCIKSVSGKALCKIVGWKLKRIVGSHHIYAKEQFEPPSIPVHGNRDLPIGTLKHYIKMQDSLKQT